MPVMSSLSELFDRLDSTISSNASVSAIRMQLGTLREQAEAVESRANELEGEAQNKDFAAERERLTSELAAANRKIEELQNEIVSLRQPAPQLEPNGLKILEYFFQQGLRTVSDVTESVRISPGMVKYHRDVLLEMGLLCEAGMNAYESALYDVTPKGRRYLHDYYERQKANEAS